MRWKFRLAAEFGNKDVTAAVSEFVRQSGVRDGVVVVAAWHSRQADSALILAKKAPKSIASGGCSSDGCQDSVSLRISGR